MSRQKATVGPFSKCCENYCEILLTPWVFTIPRGGAVLFPHCSPLSLTPRSFIALLAPTLFPSCCWFPEYFYITPYRNGCYKIIALQKKQHCYRLWLRLFLLHSLKFSWWKAFSIIVFQPQHCHKRQYLILHFRLSLIPSYYEGSPVCPGRVHEASSCVWEIMAWTLCNRKLAK